MRCSKFSPSQMIAALFLRGPVRCRSRQLNERLSFPPTNHLANGGLDQSRTRSHFLNQSSSDARSAQNLSGSSSASLYIRSYCSIDAIVACSTKLFGGGNFS